MEINWIINHTEIQKLKSFIEENDNAFLRARISRNVEKKNISITKNSIIRNLMMCLLTSQQRSGPDSPVGNFLRKKPFPINDTTVSETENIEVFLKQTLKQHDLPRYINRISKFFTENIVKIENDNWQIIERLEYLNKNQSKETERKLADFLNDWLKGFGPKQSRNFLQSLGLTKYEIPIDSRITSWLNKFGFPLSLKSSPLSDQDYYHFVLDGIQELCLKANVLPCVLDAAIFSSYDSNKWSERNIIY